VTAGRDGPGAFGVALFRSIQGALYAERLLRTADVPCKLIPVPRRIASDCGVCLRFSLPERGRVEAALADHDVGIMSWEML
jgi:hypothetical protein